MSIHYRPDSYYYFVGRTLYDAKRHVRRIIQRFENAPDTVYRMTNGQYGNAYCIYVMVEGSDTRERFCFRNFIEVIQKYGELDGEKPTASITVKPYMRELRSSERAPSFEDYPEIIDYRRIINRPKQWAKIHPEHCENVGDRNEQ